MSIKLDLHIHSQSRGKIFINDQQLINSLKQKKLDGVAITNFFDISHALWLKQKVNGFIIIVGQEIWTNEGHIIGLGLRERIGDFQNVFDTIGLIHGQGGIAIAVHPCVFLGVGKKVMSLPIDAIETYNGLLGYYIIYNFLSRRIAQNLNIPQIASSDTTDPRFIGHCYSEVMTDDIRLVLQAIKAGHVRPFKRPLPIPFIFILKNILKFRNLEPCLIHAVPCFICDNSMTIRLFRERFKCFDCCKVEVSRIACCNGHYICKDCLERRSRQEIILNK